jgi:hypothetical protein
MEKSYRSFWLMASSPGESSSQSSLPLIQQDISRDSSYGHHKASHLLSLSSVLRNIVRSKRFILRMIVAIVSCLVFFVWWRFPEIPPLYESYKLEESLLPQNQPGPPLNRSQEIKYFFPANHVNGTSLCLIFS